MTEALYDELRSRLEAATKALEDKLLNRREAAEFLGVREQTYVLLFGPLGVSGTAAAAMSLTNYALTNLVVGLLGGISYALESTQELVANE